MSKDPMRPIVWALVVALYIGLFALIAHDYRGGQQANDDSTDQPSDGLPSVFIGLTATGWTAVFTAVLTVVAVWQIALWRRANATAEKASAEATRSVDAYMDAERGRMVYESFEWHEGGDSFRVVCRNFGRSVAIVRGLRICLSREEVPHTPGGYESFVRPGKKFVGGIDGDKDIPYYPVTKAIRDRVVRGDILDVEIMVLYEAMGGTFFEMQHSIRIGRVEGEWTTANVMSTDYPLTRELAMQLLYDPTAMDYFERIASELEKDKENRQTTS
ncbi:MAG: hypothetical protein IPJ76_14170 [Flavobacteriales bacterium]|nr:MAG: hypothetical protein IPJ76_14170 [Flavobacteriales bacterium]